MLSGQHGPDIVDVPAEGLCAMERFHNIVALHKAGPDRPVVPVSWLAEPPESERTALSQQHRVEAADLGALTADDLTRRFDATPMGGALVMARGAIPQETAGFLASRFVEIDHMEQRVHFPEVPVHPMADTLRALSVTADCIALWRAPNLYPSNFAFDASAPQAARALARIDEIMGDGQPWPGAIRLAEFKMRYGRPEEAAELLARFGDGEGQPRTFYYMASSATAATGDRQKAREFLERGAAQYPDDPRLVSTVAGFRQQEGAVEEAEAMLRAALEKTPRNRMLHARMGRLQMARGNLEQAAQSTEMAISLTPAHARDALRLFLAQVRMRQGRMAEAEAILSDMTADGSPAKDKACRLLSELSLATGKRTAALEFIDQALALKPDNEAYQRFRQRIAG